MGPTLGQLLTLVQSAMLREAVQINLVTQGQLLGEDWIIREREPLPARKYPQGCPLYYPNLETRAEQRILEYGCAISHL